MNDLNLPTLDIEDIDIDEIEQSKMDLVEDESGGAIRYGIVGSGQGGGRMAKAFFDLGYRKTIAFNLAQSDLNHLGLPENHKHHLVYEGASGAGKNHAVSKKAFDDKSQEVFNKYKLSPEFQKINKGMNLDGFKSIFWFEFLHRLWGRLIGVVFFLPFIFFLVCGWVNKRLAPKLILMFLLGGLQGVLGWYMVKSGLVDRPDVSQYRLTAHFSLALIIIGTIEYVALGLLFPKFRGVQDKAPLGLFAIIILLWAFVTALSGGFVAGIDAGFSYNTFPFMDGSFFPTGSFSAFPIFPYFF